MKIQQATRLKTKTMDRRDDLHIYLFFCVILLWFVVSTGPSWGDESSADGTHQPTAADGNPKNGGSDMPAPAATPSDADARSPVASEDDPPGGNPPAEEHSATQPAPSAAVKDSRRHGNSNNGKAITAEQLAPQTLDAAKPVGPRTAKKAIKTARAGGRPLSARPEARKAGASSIARYSETTSSKGDRMPAVSDPGAAILGLCAVHDNYGIVGQAMDASGALLKRGEQALYGLVTGAR